ncbi:MAG: hypothetical protein VZR00_08410 [Lachnospiraceae bacterium]|jgi:hypothetical protein|nr:hypothetical protein [Lachnospiraceae bacterium]MEE3461890.1 hypothetical protein [Lachnospiraceae bacterium]
MTIAFWKPPCNIKGYVGVTANLALLSSAINFDRRVSCILLENGYSPLNLGSVFMNRYGISAAAENTVYDKRGIEIIMQRILNGERINKETILSASMQVYFKDFIYIPQSRILNSEIFDERFSRTYRELYKSLNKYFYYTFTDIQRFGGTTSQIVISSADIVVVNLLQNREMYRTFVTNYLSSIGNKAFFLICRYRAESDFDIVHALRMKGIPMSRIAFVPYSIEFEEAAQMSSIVHFVNNNYVRSKTRNNIYFMREIRSAVTKLVFFSEMIRSLKNDETDPEIEFL